MTDYDTVQAMIRYGGNFASRLGELWCVADRQNQARLTAAFADTWAEYREIAEQHQQKRQATR